MEQEIAQVIGQIDMADMARGAALVKVIEMTVDVALALGLLWALSGDHKIGRALFPFADEMRTASGMMLNDGVSDETKASILQSLSRVAAARVLGFFILLAALSMI